MSVKQFDDLCADTHERVERRQGLLKNHRHFTTAQCTQPFRCHGGDILAIDTGVALSDFQAARQEAHQRAGGDRFAGT